MTTNDDDDDDDETKGANYFFLWQKYSFFANRISSCHKFRYNFLFFI